MSLELRFFPESFPSMSPPDWRQRGRLFKDRVHIGSMADMVWFVTPLCVEQIAFHMV